MVVMKEKLIEMVKKGISDKEIMQGLGIQTEASLGGMYYDALVEAGKIKDIVIEKEAKKATSTKRAFSIGKKGIILLSKGLLVDQFGFKEGDKFEITKRRGTIILSKKRKEQRNGKGKKG